MERGSPRGSRKDRRPGRLSGTLRSVDSHPPAGGSGPLDERLRDDAVLAEIDLVSRLMIAASGASSRLSATEIDVLLGLEIPLPDGRRMNEQ